MNKKFGFIISLGFYLSSAIGSFILECMAPLVSLVCSRDKMRASKKQEIINIKVANVSGVIEDFPTLSIPADMPNKKAFGLIREQVKPKPANWIALFYDKTLLHENNCMKVLNASGKNDLILTLVYDSLLQLAELFRGFKYGDTQEYRSITYNGKSVQVLLSEVVPNPLFNGMEINEENVSELVERYEVAFSEKHCGRVVIKPRHIFNCLDITSSMASYDGSAMSRITDEQVNEALQRVRKDSEYLIIKEENGIKWEFIVKSHQVISFITYRPNRVTCSLIFFGEDNNECGAFHDMNPREFLYLLLEIMNK